MHVARDDRFDSPVARLHSMEQRIAAHTAIESLLAAHAKSMPRSSSRSLSARIFGAPVLTPDTRSRYLRAVTGRQVGTRLDALGSDWVVVNAVPLGGGHPYLDHLVIGPTGVVAVTIAAAERDELWDAAPGARRLRERRALRESEFAIGAVERRLTDALVAPAGEPTEPAEPDMTRVRETVRVTGLIVGNERPEHRSLLESPDLHIVVPAGVADWIRGLPGTLTPAEVLRVGDVAALASTWHSEAHPPACGTHLLLAFEALQREVRTAERRRRLWLLSLPAALVGMVTLSALAVLDQAGLFG